jgi:hypothetical protein
VIAEERVTSPGVFFKKLSVKYHQNIDEEEAYNLFFKKASLLTTIF